MGEDVKVRTGAYRRRGAFLDALRDLNGTDFSLEEYATMFTRLAELADFRRKYSQLPSLPESRWDHGGRKFE